jgi:hypothetical protein
MKVKNMPSAIQQRNSPEVIRSLSGMNSPDYIDVFTVTTNQRCSSCLSGGVGHRDRRCGGSGGQFIWRGFLGLRLTSRPSTERVGGALASLLGGLIGALGAAAVFLTLNRQRKDERGRIYSALRTEVMECR